MGKKSHSENPLLKQALAYQRWGWSIIPIKPRSKLPALRKWEPFQTKRPDGEQLRKWFGNGNRNIAVIVGEVSNGLACRDFDTMAEYQLWARNYPELAKMLPTVQTAKGMHVYFEGHFDGIKHISNGELRGSRGYCLLPPSVHPDGAIYQWVNPIFNGNLLAVDPILAGFLPKTTNVTENTEQPEQTEQSEAIVKEDSFENVILKTLPKGYGTRNRKIFDFARALKSLPQFVDADPKQLRNIVKVWHKRALPKIRTKEFEETWIDFLKAWPKIKYKIGDEPMAKIFEKAVKLEPPNVAVEKYPANRKVQILVSLCRELQRAAGENPFYLAARTAGRLLGVSHMQASRWLFLLESDEILKVVCKGGTAEAARKATRFRYIGG
jgi:hypothetical protein